MIATARDAQRVGLGQENTAAFGLVGEGLLVGCDGTGHAGDPAQVSCWCLIREAGRAGYGSGCSRQKVAPSTAMPSMTASINATTPGQPAARQTNGGSMPPNAPPA
jgi:hypothetical protein